MGLRGPAPTPTAILRLTGTWRSKRNPAEPKPLRILPKPPIKLNKVAARIWRELIDELSQMGVIGNIDRRSLARYCHLTARWLKCEEFIADKGSIYVIKEKDGSVRYIQQYPQVSEANKLAAQLTRLEQEFGMTPASRARVRAEHKPENDQEDDLDERMLG